jgi:hypothetical protein
MADDTKTGTDADWLHLPQEVPAADIFTPAAAFDAVMDAALDEWGDTDDDYRVESQMIRDTLADPANRDVVVAWLRSVGFPIGEGA